LPLPWRGRRIRLEAVASRPDVVAPLYDYLIAMREPGIVVAPRAALRGPEEACPRDVLIDADLSGSEVDVLLSHVSASAIEAVCLRMIDALDLETRMEMDLGRRFVGVDDHALGTTGADEYLAFRLDDCRD
jgi:hypothetical protein